MSGPPRPCRWCGKPAAPRRKYCSDECLTKRNVRDNPGFARHQVWLRDRGVCALCGVDTDALRERWRQAASDDPEAQKLAARYGGLYGYRQRQSWWDMDHIRPRAEGGNGCQLDNLRTLCLPCHKRETASLAARRAASRRDLHPWRAGMAVILRHGGQPLKTTVIERITATQIVTSLYPHLRFWRHSGRCAQGNHWSIEPDPACLRQGEMFDPHGGDQ